MSSNYERIKRPAASELQAPLPPLPKTSANLQGADVSIGEPADVPAPATKPDVGHEQIAPAPGGGIKTPVP